MMTVKPTRVTLMLDGHHAVNVLNISYYLVLVFDWNSLTVVIYVDKLRAVNEHKIFCMSKSCMLRHNK